MNRIYCPHDDAADSDGYVSHEPAPKLRGSPDFDLVQALGTAYGSYVQARLYDMTKALDIVECEMKQATGWRREYLANLHERLKVPAQSTGGWLNGVCGQMRDSEGPFRVDCQMARDSRGGYGR